MEGTRDERYATFREHAELRERTASLEATMQQVGPALARIETMVAARSVQQPVDHGALAMQRALDALSTSKTNGSPIATIASVILALSTGVLLALQFIR